MPPLPMAAWALIFIILDIKSSIGINTVFLSVLI
jgi:hypothetical protein